MLLRFYPQITLFSSNRKKMLCWQVTQPISKQHAKSLTAWVWHLTVVAFTLWFILLLSLVPCFPCANSCRHISMETVTLLVHLSQLSSKLFSQHPEIDPNQGGCSTHYLLHWKTWQEDPYHCSSCYSRHHKTANCYCENISLLRHQMLNLLQIF